MRNAGKAEYICIGILLLWFIIKGVYFSVHLSPGMAPDEMFHMQVVDIYSRSATLFPFSDSGNPFAKPLPEFVRFGRTTEYPGLYYLISGFLNQALHLDAFEFSTILVMRLFNLFISVLNLLLIFAIGRKFLERNVRILFYFICTNTLMYTVLSSSVSYDLLANLAGTAGLWFLIKLEHDGNIHDFLALLQTMLLGILIKLNVLPLAAVFSSIGLWLVFKSPGLQNGLKQLQARYLPLYISTAVIAAFVGLFFFAQYSKYGSIMPTCDQIYSAEACAPFVQPLEDNVIWPVTIWEYPFVWLFYMISSSFGVRSDIGVAPPEAFTLLVECFFLLGTAAFLFFSKNNRRIKVLVSAALLYGAVVFWYCGLYMEHALVAPSMGVNGRYAFIIGAPLAVFLAQGFVLPFSSTRKLVIFVLCILFLWSEFPRFLLSESGQHFMKPRAPAFYKLQTYFPNPVYDTSFRRVE